MRPMDATGGTIFCDHCGASESLPQEATARVAALRLRLAEVRKASESLQGIDRGVSAALESSEWIRGTLKAALGPVALITVLVVAPPALRIFSEPGAMHDESAVRGLSMGIGLLVQLVAIVAGMSLAYYGVARRYRRVVRPHILARAPIVHGQPGRCRVCGGKLPESRAAFVTCGWCGATSLVTPELARERERLLRAEADEYRARATGARNLVAEHHRLMSSGVFLGNLLPAILANVAAFPLARWGVELVIESLR